MTMIREARLVGNWAPEMDLQVFQETHLLASAGRGEGAPRAAEPARSVGGMFCGPGE